MTHDPALEHLGGLPMPNEPETRWPPLDLAELYDRGEIRIIDQFEEPPTEHEEPAGRLPQSWGDLHDEFLNRLRDSSGAAQRQLRYALDGCKTFHYHQDVRDHLEVALDQILEAGRLMDIHDPE